MKNGLANSITNRQMFFIIFLTLTTYSTIDLPKIMAENDGRSGWIPILAMSVAFGIVAIVITKLNNMHQGKVFFDYSREITGKFLSFILILLYIIYFFIIVVYLKVKMVTLIKANFLPLTSRFVILLVSIFMFGFVVYKGVTNIARLFEIIGILFLGMTILICIFMLTRGTKYNILPLYNRNEAKDCLKTLRDLATPFTGLTVIFIIPFSSLNRKAPRVAFLSLLFIGILYVLIIESTIMILGINNTIVLNDAFIEAVKIVELPIIERTDIFYLTFGISSLFAGIIMVFAVVVELVCRLLPKIKRYIIVMAAETVCFALSFLGLNIHDLRDIFESFLPYLVLSLEVFIPLLLFITVKVKKRVSKKQRRGGGNNEIS